MTKLLLPLAAALLALGGLSTPASASAASDIHEPACSRTQFPGCHVVGSQAEETLRPGRPDPVKDETE